MIVGYPGVSELNPTIQLTLMLNKSKASKSIKSVKVNAPSFDGCLDPQVYIDWQLVMDCYFRWHDMSESKKIQFAMMKLTGQAG